MLKTYIVTAVPKTPSYAGGWTDKGGVQYRVFASTKAEAISRARKERRMEEGRMGNPIASWKAEVEEE